MSAVRLAVGIGCRKGCDAAAIAALVRQARRLAEPACDDAAAWNAATLCSSRDKASEPGIAAAAADLALPLVLVPRDALEEAAARCETRSERVQALLGLPSLAEAAALAGAGAGSRLIVTRISAGGASCAIALAADGAPA